MAFVCLSKDKVQEFRDVLKKRSIKIEDLLNMESEARTALFEKYAGENAKSVNALFEEKLILKNRLQGIKNWVRKVGEVGRYDPTKKAKLEQLMSEYRARQQERIFSPKENESFLADLAEETLGVRISKTEAKTMFDLTAKAEELKKDFNEKTGEWSSEKDRFDYGSAKVISEKYVESLKGEGASFKDVLKGKISEVKQQYKEDVFKATRNLIGDTLKTISENAISLVASVDNSFLGRQGLHALQTHPSAWWSGAKNSFVDFYKTLGGKETMDALNADIYSRQNYLNGRYQLAKIITKTEEQFPTSIPERIPVIGRVFKASENAFRGSALRMRTDLFDLVSEIAEKNGVEMSEKQIKDIGRLTNSVTARGSLGKYGETPIVRLVLWAPRMIKANWDVLTSHTGGVGLETAFARKQAALNLVKIASETALVIMIANAIKPGSAETDPRSSDFGKIKIGDTRFDISGGASSLVTLASRLATNSSKSTTTGVVKQFGNDYGQQTRFDAFIDFLTGKTAPATRVVIDSMKGENWKGDKLTLKGAVYGATVPISIQNAIALKDGASADRVLGVLADTIGISANAYKAETDWGQNTGVEMQQFKQKIGDKRFKEANDLYNKRFNEWLNSVKTSPKFSVLSEDDKQKAITNKKSEIKDKIFKQYGFSYKQVPVKKLPKL